MTQILLHAANGPYDAGRVALTPPWMWWETRVAGDLLCRWEPNTDDVEKVYYTFGPDADRVLITDPPSLFLIHLQEYDDRYYGEINRAMMISSVLTARVVWHTQPGPQWWPVPNVMTCRVGWYEQNSHTRAVGERRREPEDWTTTFLEPMPGLVWPMNPMIVDGQSLGPPTTTSYRCRQCQRYLPAGGAGMTEVRSWGGDLIGVLQGGELCEECRRMQRPRRRSNPGDVLVFDGQGWSPASREAAAAMELDRQEIAAAYGIPGAIMAQIYTPNEIREREGLAPIPDLGEPMTIQEFERLRGRPAIADEISGGLAAGVYGPAILPEQDVVDEIDRLVNEELRTGPVDDYNVNRYPRCAHCPHQWHGEPCEKCSCLGEFEDPI